METKVTESNLRLFRCRRMFCRTVLLKVGNFDKTGPWFIEIMGTKDVYRGMDWERNTQVSDYLNKPNKHNYVIQYSGIHTLRYNEGFKIKCRCNVCGRDNSFNVRFKKIPIQEKFKTLMRFGRRVA